VVTKITRKIVKIDEEKCNGCGVCIIACAEGALEIIDGKARLVSEQYCLKEKESEETLACGCSSTTVTTFDKQSGEASSAAETPLGTVPSRLGHWPVQLTLVPPNAPFLKDADLILAADCVPFAYAGFHQDFLGEDRALLVACPKLDDFQAHQKKLNEVLRVSDIKSLTVVHMEVPCCSGLVHMAKQAIIASGKDIPFADITISARGELKYS